MHATSELQLWGQPHPVRPSPGSGPGAERAYNWSTCAGVQHGYPCGLWELFHTLTLVASTSASASTSVADADADADLVTLVTLPIGAGYLALPSFASPSLAPLLNAGELQKELVRDKSSGRGVPEVL